MSEKTNLAVEASAAALGSKATVGGGATSAAAFFIGINWIGWLSLGIALLGLIINFYFSWQRNRREKAEHELKMNKLRGDCNAEQN